MAERFFVDRPIAGDRAVLDGPEAHHLIHVMRARPGTRVVLFDGSGAEFPAEVRQLHRSEVELAVQSRELVDRELPLRLVLAVALPKGDRQKWLIEKAVELGVTQFVPLSTVRSVAQPAEQALARWRRSVIEASKQCGRNRLMELASPQNWEAFCGATVEVPCRLMAHPTGPQAGPEDSGTPAVAIARLNWTARPDAAVLAIGPEGGFSPQEAVQAVAAGWQRVDLGPRILRVETAALVLAAGVIQRAAAG
jgi:16S rRNA (uracil1498-N3)-methyltransferase